MIGPVLGMTLIVIGLVAVGTYVFAAVAHPRVRSGSLSLLLAGTGIIVLGLWLTTQKW